MTPGSPEAVKLGCECSVFDNQSCKIHGDPQQVAFENMTFNHPAN